MLPNFKSDDPYIVLGCRRGDSAADIKKAYRKLAIQVSSAGVGVGVPESSGG